MRHAELCGQRSRACPDGSSRTTRRVPSVSGVSAAHERRGQAQGRQQTRHSCCLCMYACHGQVHLHSKKRMYSCMGEHPMAWVYQVCMVRSGTSGARLRPLRWLSRMCMSYIHCPTAWFVIFYANSTAVKGECSNVKLRS